LRARVITGFCPAMRVRSPAAACTFLVSDVDSPTPMLTTILSSLGTASAFGRPSFFCSSGRSTFS
jgi:hypothetical protein